MSAAQFLRGAGDGSKEVTVAEVWDINWTAVEIFERCEPDVTGIGMGGLYFRSIAAGEIESACRLSGIPEGAWPELIDDVRHMGRVVANARNIAADRARQTRRH
jgi:hypothetical protein